MALLANDIYVGSVNNPLYHFTNSNAELSGFKGNFALDVIGNELSVDQFTANIHWTEDDMFDGFITSDDKDFQIANGEDLLVLKYAGASTELKDFLKELPFGTPVWWYVNGVFYAKGYLKSVDRVSKNNFKITCVSGVGLLDTSMHTGGIYQNASITTVLANIIGNAFTYTVSQAVQNTARVYGRLPYDTRRNNLHRLLFASGAALMRGTANNDYVIDYLSNTITNVPSSRVALQGSVQYQLPSNKVEITEHTFFQNASAETVTLYDNMNEAAADNLTVIFEGAAYDLATTGSLTISESGVNYAVVSGIGTLTGKYYTHTTQIKALTNNPNNDPLRVRRVTENELITAVNSYNVARRVLSYYQSAKTVKAKILTDGEKCGSLLRFTDSFGDATQGYLSKMDTLVTTVVGAQCQLIDGFQPGNNGNNFLHRAIITSTGSWTVPSNVTHIRAIIIGGGNGGQGGHDGADGAGSSALTLVTTYWGDIDGYDVFYGYANGNQPVPYGGAAGSAGSASPVLAVDIDVSSGEVISVTVGKGGAGGVRNGGSGSNGTASIISSTSVGTKSSASGLLYPNGYYDSFSDTVFALPGISGYAGGNGGQTDRDSLYARSYANGFDGDTVGGFLGGSGGSPTHAEETKYVYPYDITFTADAPGGGGGGAAYGGIGQPGGKPTISPSSTQYSWYPNVTTGSGGDGANAISPHKPTYGCGGGGGNGGGGGGNIGGTAYECYGGLNNPTAGTPGKGGTGSAGGAGGDGCVIFYY